MLHKIFNGRLWFVQHNFYCTLITTCQSVHVKKCCEICCAVRIIVSLVTIGVKCVGLDWLHYTMWSYSSSWPQKNVLSLFFCFSLVKVESRIEFDGHNNNYHFSELSCLWDEIEIFRLNYLWKYCLPLILLISDVMLQDVVLSGVRMSLHLHVLAFVHG